jgi:tetratricopeptide (TPR) repeat protein
MSFLSRLFGSKDAPAQQSTGRLTQRLEKLEAEAETAAPGYVGTSYNRAGDVSLRSGDRERAVAYYGRAIDAFLEDGQREAARGVANKIIRVRPTAVRALCTLTWLDLAAKHSATALLHLRDYVLAANWAARV